MKISVEIKDEKLIYDYKVGMSEQHGDLQLTAENFLVFSKIISDCCAGLHRDYKKFIDEMTAKAYMEKNPAAAQEYLDLRYAERKDK